MTLTPTRIIIAVFDIFVALWLSVTGVIGGDEGVKPATVTAEP